VHSVPFFFPPDIFECRCSQGTRAVGAFRTGSQEGLKKQRHSPWRPPSMAMHDAWLSSEPCTHTVLMNHCNAGGNNKCSASLLRAFAIFWSSSLHRTLYCGFPETDAVTSLYDLWMNDGREPLVVSLGLMRLETILRHRSTVCMLFRPCLVSKTEKFSEL